MERLTPQPRPRHSVSDRLRRTISTFWLVTSLALPFVAIMLAAAGTSARASASAGTHQVRAGESLDALAVRYGVPLDQLLLANGLTDPQHVYAGQTIVLPRTTGENQTIYTIRAGETLAAIARRYGVSVDAIVAANGLVDRNDIQAGQQLIIPAVLSETTPESTVNYLVRRGDSLYRIALVFGVSVDDLLAANSLASPNAIYPGLILRIPVPTALGMSEGEASADTENAGSLTYVVQRGDTLAGIALRYEVTVDGLVSANGLSSPNQIYQGQVLNIPDSGGAARENPAQTGVAHIVQLGETLAQIAARYGVTVHALAVANNLDESVAVYPGLALSIPTVQSGSTSVLYANAGTGQCEGVSVDKAGTGYFVRPTQAYIITQRFLPWHSGIDLAGDLGSPISASDNGTVVYAGWNTVGYGNLVILDHGNGWRTYYAHLSEVYAECGAWVSRGDRLGAMGSTGNSTGPHLHFEMLRFGIPVNPEGYLRF
jgi:murein DD-endopeptidase MepM/ murein hydrolase activator NlpD